MSYWNDSMHDDVTLIVGEGWETAAKPRPARTWKDKNNKTKYEDAHLTLGTGARAVRWVMDLIPPDYIAGRFFSAERAELEKLTADLEAATQAVDEYTEEHAVEDGLLWEAVEDDKITSATVKNRLRDSRIEGSDPDEIEALEQLLSLFAAESAARKIAKEAATALDGLILAQYSKLTSADIKTLVVDDKWGRAIEFGVESELVLAVQQLTSRLHVLAGRYEATLEELDARIASLNARVAEHLAAMGVRE